MANPKFWHKKGTILNTSSYAFPLICFSSVVFSSLFITFNKFWPLLLFTTNVSLSLSPPLAFHTLTHTYNCDKTSLTTCALRYVYFSHFRGNYASTLLLCSWLLYAFICWKSKENMSSNYSCSRVSFLLEIILYERISLWKLLRFL